MTIIEEIRMPAPPDKVCTIQDCYNKPRKHGLCRNHARGFRNYTHNYTQQVMQHKHRENKAIAKQNNWSQKINTFKR